MSRNVPTAPLTRSAGYDPSYIDSGAYRTMSYNVWQQQQSEQAKLGGNVFRSPERKPTGEVDGISHRAESPDEIIDFFSRMMGAVNDRRDNIEAERIATAKAAELGELAKRAASGDSDAVQQMVARSIMELRATDPLILPQPVPTPADFAAEFATPLDTTELITLCDETGLYRALPEHTEDTKTELWRELTLLEFMSGCNMIAFEAGGCPEEFQHQGENKSIDLKHIGVKKTLTESDIRHSIGSIAAGYGIRELVGGFRDGGLPGESDMPSLIRGNIANAKEKEMRLGSILTLNGWDELLVKGDDTNAEEFDGLINLITAGNGARVNGGTLTGTYSATVFDAFMSAGCAHPDAIIGHPSALAAIALGYFGLGSQTVFYNNNENIVPGLHFAGEIMTGFGPVALIGDSRFLRTTVSETTFRSTVYPVKLRHNGEDLIYKRTQIPLSMKDLAPGCTAVSFMVWAVTALVVKGMCAQSAFTGVFNGINSTQCNYVHPCLT